MCINYLIILLHTILIQWVHLVETVVPRMEHSTVCINCADNSAGPWTGATPHSPQVHLEQQVFLHHLKTNAPLNPHSFPSEILS